MRLAAWNCCSGPLAGKLAALATLAADIAVIPECPRIPETPDAAVWIGTNPHKGLASCLRHAPYRIARAEAPTDLPRYVVPLLVSGPEAFLLFAIWAQNDGADRYVRGIHRAVAACESLIRAHPTVMLGDFNSNSIWDHEHPKDKTHSALVRQLATMGLTSVYHGHYVEEHGAETRATFFEYRHEHRPFHIDYCFLPTVWLSRVTSVAIGGHSAWARWSDHMPLTVDIQGAARDGGHR